MPHITVSNITIEIVRKDIKNLHLAVYPPTGRVRIAAPLRLDDEAVRLFAIAKLGWIKQHQRSFAAQERETQREYVSGESHYFAGQRYLLNVIYGTTRPQVIIRQQTHLDLYVPAGSATAQREAVLTRWYRARLKETAQPLLTKWQAEMGVGPVSWHIKRMKTKWGTCHIAARRIWLNLELAKKPPQCLEYIIVHELTHLLERHHNARFMGWLDTYLPHWRQFRAELNGSLLSHEDWPNEDCLSQADA